MNRRQLDLLKTLYGSRKFLTLSEMADMFKVSTKTIRNDITSIKEYLAAHNAGSLETKPHVGVRTVITHDEWLRLADDADDDGESREILFFIIKNLMRNGCLTAQRLSEQYYLGRTELDRLIDRAAEWFSDNHIHFKVRRGIGISVNYSEFNFRLAMMHLFTEFWDMFTDTISTRSPQYATMPDDEYTAMCAILNGFEADSVAKILLETEEKFGLKFNYSSNNNLMFLISHSILRFKNGNQIQMPRVEKCAVDGESDLAIATFILQKLEERFSLNFSDEEREFIRFAVSVSRVQSFANDEKRDAFEQMNIELCRFTIKAVRIIGEVTGVNLVDDEIFVREMFLLLKTIISRLKYGIKAKNSLLPQIKLKYPNMMAIAWSLENMFEKELKIQINEHDAGFLALYIGGAIERKLPVVKACIICDEGVGTSHILKEQLMRAVPELMITSVLSVRDIKRIKQEDCDFIISTIPLDGYRFSHDVLYIRCLLDSADIHYIENYIVNIKAQKKLKVKNIQPTATLFKKDLIFTRYHATDKTELLKTMCSNLECMGFVTADFEKSVLEREKTAATDIGKGFALPHGKSDFINRSAVVFISLDKPIKWNESGEYIDLIFLLAIDMSESEETKQTIIKFYKSIVDFMKDERICEKLRISEDSDEILELFEM